LKRTARRTVDRVLEPSIARSLSKQPQWQRLDALGAAAHRPLEFSSGTGQRASLLLRMLEPLDVADGTFGRLGRDHDGGYVMVIDKLTGGVAYSLGISDDVSWDRSMADRGYDVYQYDHTIDDLPDYNEKFHFHRVGISGYGRDDATFQSLDTVLRSNNHVGRDDLVLKIDIEGAEWDVFSSILDTTLLSFRQIVVEFHWFGRAGDDEFFAKAYAALSRLRTHFDPVHVHANNHYGFQIVGGVAVPDLLEVTYIRKGIYQTKPSDRVFPTEIDQPNWTARPDLWLGSFKYPAPIPAKVTRDEIRRAYNLVLRREPEEAAYTIQARHANYDELVRSLLNSDEFNGLKTRWEPFYNGIEPASILKRHEYTAREPVRGSIVNFLGVSTDLQYVNWASEGVEDIPIGGNFHATRTEWAAALRAVDLAHGHFTVVELGAGWGCWMVNTAVAAKRRGLTVTAIGVEGDRKHVEFMHRHCAVNGLTTDEFLADESVVGQSGGAAFPVYEAAGSSYGQEPRFFHTDEELDRFVQQNRNFRKLQAKTLADVFGDRERIDLLHIDIQGGEEELIRISMQTLKERVAYVVVGTHGRDLEGQIMGQMLKEGWVLEVEEPCSLPLPLRYQFPYIDGVQGWRNPRLTN
jgi:FkbM family methyltransferase